MSYKNAEGYKDPTVGAVLAKEMKEFRQAQRQKYQDKNRCKVYVASAYAGDTEGNTARAVQYCRFAIDKGYLPIASHLLYPQVLSDAVPAERELGLLFGLALLATCQECWFFGELSPGMEQEMQEAKRLRKKIRRFDQQMMEVSS